MITRKEIEAYLENENIWKKSTKEKKKKAIEKVLTENQTIDIKENIPTYRDGIPMRWKYILCEKIKETLEEDDDNVD